MQPIFWSMSGTPDEPYYDFCILWRHPHAPRQTDRQTARLKTVYCAPNMQNRKLSCAPPDQYKATLCTTKVCISTELHCETWYLTFEIYRNTIERDKEIKERKGKKEIKKERKEKYIYFLFFSFFLSFFFLPFFLSLFLSHFWNI